MFDSLITIVQNFLSTVVSLFPLSPFRGFIQSLQTLPYLGWLNWFFPVGQCLTILTAWLVAIGTFYLWSVVARWVKLIGD